MSAEIRIPKTDFVLVLSDDKDTRLQIVKDFTARCSDVLQGALKWAPNSTISVLQVYFYFLLDYTNKFKRHFFETCFPNFSVPIRVLG